MKKIYSFLTVMSLVIIFSCADPSLDPLQFDKVKKGTILALRGRQLDNIYNKEIPGAEFFPRIANGTEKFVFDAEFLSGDPNSLSSVDVYALKKTGATKERILLVTVSGADFEITPAYTGPWTTISIKLSDILSKIGLPSTFPMSESTITSLLSDYKLGISIECDLNLKDGTKVLASDIVAAGLFQSNQFYPAMKLNYAVTEYCAYDNTNWAGTYDAIENYSNGVSGPYDNSLVQDQNNPNKFVMNNFYGLAGTYAPLSAYLIFTPSKDPGTQVVTMPSQDDGHSGTISGEGTYNQCLNRMIITVHYIQTYNPGPLAPPGTYDWRYDLSKQ